MPIRNVIQHFEPMFKNPAFSEEEEWRVMLFGGDRALTSPNLDFRFKEDDILPYYEFDIRGAISE